MYGRGSLETQMHGSEPTSTTGCTVWHYVNELVLMPHLNLHSGDNGGDGSDVTFGICCFRDPWEGTKRFTDPLSSATAITAGKGKNTTT